MQLVGGCFFYCSTQIVGEGFVDTGRKHAAKTFSPLKDAVDRTYKITHHYFFHQFQLILIGRSVAQTLQLVFDLFFGGHAGVRGHIGRNEENDNAATNPCVCIYAIGITMLLPYVSHQAGAEITAQHGCQQDKAGIVRIVPFQRDNTSYPKGGLCRTGNIFANKSCSVKPT